MAAIRCAGVGRALLRRAPGILRRAAVGELQHRIAPLSLLSKRSMSSDYVEEHYNKELAAALMKQRSSGNEIENMDEMLRLMNSHADKVSLSFVSAAEHAMSDPCRQLAAARSAIEEKRLDLISHLLRPGGGGQETVKKKMEDLAVAVRHQRLSLIVEDLKRKCKGSEELQIRLFAAMLMIWGIPLTIAVIAQMH